MTRRNIIKQMVHLRIESVLIVLDLRFTVCSVSEIDSFIVFAPIRPVQIEQLNESSLPGIFSEVQEDEVMK
ncbi:hypothetical protein JCM19376_16820 [Fusibacter bizertensis]